ncbi:MAG: hypothetical protein ACI4MJ_02210 [Aristaeellaceae bacterium]
MGKTVIRIVLVTALLAMLMLLVPSAAPLAIGEELSGCSPVLCDEWSTVEGSAL